MTKTIRASVFCVLLALLSGRFALAQHETGSDLFGGEQAYQNFCANCHGKVGNQIAQVDLSRGNFRKPYSDDELTNIIVRGIAGTPMPATPNMSREQAMQIVAWLRSRAVALDASAGGDAVRGQALFVGKGQCLACHRINGVGSRLGPDLSRIGKIRTPYQLLTSLLDPDAEVQPGNRSYSISTRDGQQVSGRLLNHDVYTVLLIDSNEQLRSFMKADLREQGFIPSPMPSLRGKLDGGELADLVQYLVSQRGVAK
jgi:putative heme-binding domain-containing protein